MIVLLVWIAAVVVAAALLAVLAFELRGHTQRFRAALGLAGDLTPQVQRLIGRLTEPASPDGPNGTLEGPGRHRADP